MSAGSASRRPRRRGCVLVLLLLLAALAVGGFFAFQTARALLFEPHQGYAGDEVTVEVAPGSDGRRILEQMEAAGVLADATAARAYLVYRLGDPPLRAGEYRFAGPQSTVDVLDKLIRGEVVTYPVTLVEGLDLEETAGHLAEAGFGELEGFLAAMRDPGAIADLDPLAEDLEGYLFPDTYSFARGTSEAEIVATLVRTFRSGFEENLGNWLSESAEGGGDGDPEEAESPSRLSVRELVTLASIIEKEARIDDERPVISAVYHNRLRRGIGLYADPTVIYALKRRGTWDGNIRKPDLQVDSPYNTYRYPGLPPGPIASPGLASLEAAAQPAEVPYLYFVSRNDGSHVFARTLAEHNRNVDRWQRRYWRERWAKERAEREDGRR